MSNNIPAIVLYQAPSVEPLSVDEVKAYLRIDGNTEDALITSMIKSARTTAEKYMGLSLISQKWKLSFDDICAQEIELPYGPVVGIDLVKLYDAQNAETTFSTGNYYLTSGNLSIYFREIPSSQRVEIIYSTGFGASAGAVPELIKQGILAHIAFMYERKFVSNQATEVAKNLYSVYRKIKI
jgi:uncharacterized phiE125 gp8 family phage protein